MPRKRTEIPKMRGVEDLLSMSVEQANSTVAIGKIQLPQKQPRRYFDPGKMSQLVESIRAHGILEPLLVRPVADGKYELVAGERRLRAAQEAGLTEVPIVSRELDQREALQISLIENLQREDLNPIEETEALLELLAIALEGSQSDVVSVLNQAANSRKRGQALTGNVTRQLEQIESILKAVGRFNAESLRTNRLPLLNLPADVLEVLRQGKLEFTKARAIARVKDEQQRAQLLEMTVTENLSLNDIKQRIQELQPSGSAPETTFTERYAQVGKRLKKAWDNPSKRKRLERLLAELEKLAEGED